MIRRGSVVLVALLCAAGAAVAQTPPSGAQADWRAKRQEWQQDWQQQRAKMEQQRMEQLAVLLDLTPAQKQQVQSIFSAERTRMQQAMAQAREARHAAHTESLTKLGQVLTPAQLKKLELLMPEHRRFFMRHGHMCAMGGMGGPMGMKGPMEMWHSHPDPGAPPPAGAGPQ